MQDYLKQLDPNLLYIRHEIQDNLMSIYCETKPLKDRPVHSRKERVIKDIPYGKYKVELHLITKKYFNLDPKAKTLTTAEKHGFLNSTKRRTKRLDELILKLCSEMSTIGCERLIRDSIADVSDTSILRLIKKNDNN